VNPPAMEDLAWLVSPEAAPWLEQAGDATVSLHTRIERLRRSVGAARAPLLTRQAELRVRGLRKFSAAANMFFTQRSLEQATDQHTAAHKAERFQPGRRIADLCCGIGGDLLSLARQGSVCGVDNDETVALFASANARALGVDANILSADVSTIPLADFDAWHLDPDRRSEKGRSTNPRWHNPPIEAVEKMLAENPHAAIKLAPAADIPVAWRASCEREWISRQGECKQQVVWRGGLARREGARSATMISSQGKATHFFAKDTEETRPPVAFPLGRYLIEPDAAVIAARLTAAIATEFQLHAVAPGVAYLTGDAAVSHAAVCCFEILDVLPFDIKQLKAYFKQHRIGRLEIKKRAVEENPHTLRKRLKLKGEHSAVLLLTPLQGRTAAIIARRAPDVANA